MVVIQRIVKNIKESFMLMAVVKESLSLNINLDVADMHCLWSNKDMSEYISISGFDTDSKGMLVYREVISNKDFAE